MKKRALVIFILGIFISAFAFASGSQEAQDSDQVLRIIHPVNSANWSPLNGGGHEVRWLSLQWASPLYFDADGEIQPYVFESWKGNSDNTVWTFSIAEDAVFSDGSPITADDVVGTWNLSTRPSTQHQRVNLFLSGVEGFDAVSTGKQENLTGLEIKDISTVEVTLSEPDPIFYQKIATALIPPVKISQAQDENGRQISEWWHPDNDPAVSGPFMPEKMNLDTGEIILVKNPNFFGPEPKLDKIIINTVEDALTATVMLQRGQMDAHTELNTPTMIQDLGRDFAEGSMLAKGHHFWFDSSKAPMDDPLVRKALILAVDSEQMFNVAFPEGPHQPATQIVNKVPGVDPDFEAYGFAPEEAKKALAESTYGNAKNLPKIMFVGVSNPSHEAAAQYVAEQWRRVLGVEGTEMKPQIDSYEGTDQGNVQVFRDDVGTRVPDIVSYLMGSIHSSSGNAERKMGGFSNAEIDALLEEASTKSVNDPDRINLAQEAQRIFRDQWQYIPYRYDTMSKWAMPWVKNFEKNDDWQVIKPWAVSIDIEQKEEMTKR
ncbi:MAG: ABC transporter substrate-binding protein [Spirochaetia bacterium]|nr:ABC transporter substrate-binding protein [Spirochaetia bacterium]MCF7945513.1 ABC transporter substrate-binding protein [Spirochaetia bacterium]MCF7946810.1 ABC transporter substrate-binding protein [Spirochaetia bacterium]